MNIIKRITWITFALFALVETAHGASFNCVKASTSIEKLICIVSDLSKLDEELSVIYKINLDVESKVLSIQSIQLAQKEWIKKRNSCPDLSFIKDEYIARIEQLSLINKADEIQNSNTINSNKAVCKTVAEYAAYGNFGSLLASEADLAPTTEEINQAFGKDANIHNVTALWTIDLDGDGILDHFTITSDYSGPLSQDNNASSLRG